ncbi:hypothetical protein [Marivita sp. GX14005]|uniref:hypothetical protein n=1 Tax=Marivita sp. GX14005 TaxID=2942276 RepID=UPI002019A08E|nr:hypothetical protein [Marivita sp. GX14005]MCL3880911.1 hypothetical protein [Marivita sp. GX14005]
MKPKRQSHYRQRDLAYAVLAVALLVAGYAAFRFLFYAGDGAVFAQESILVLLGATATIFITATLLNRQTELELRKEGSVLLLEQKNAVYMAAIETVADIVEYRRYDDELVDALRVLNHKLAVVGSRDVIEAFQLVLKRLLSGLSEGELSEAAAEEVMHAIAEVTVAMRMDTLSEIGEDLDDAVRQIILSNSHGMERIDDLHCLDPKTH